MPPESKPLSFMGVVVGALVIVVTTIVLLEKGSAALLAKQAALGGQLPDSYEALARPLNVYLSARGAYLRHWFLYSFALLLALGVCGRGLKSAAATFNRLREKAAGMDFKNERYDLPRVPFSLRELIATNPDPEHQVVLGVAETGSPVYLTDQARSMHVHVLGQTGSGKTKSVIEPLLIQDLYRNRGVLVVDAKGSQENEDRLAAMAALAGRLDEVRVFSLSPTRKSHTYNPVHVAAGGDPKAVGERVFSSFADDMDVRYYHDQAQLFFVSLVCALAGTGKRFHMLDLAAAIASPMILDFALRQTSDAKARRTIEAQLDRLGRKAGETFTGLLAAVQRYDLPALNTYDPDIILEDEVERGGVVGFFLPSNYYKQLARYIGLTVFQHVQQIGALRQLDRAGRSQQPLYVYADEFYTFAYEGFTDAVNKLRDAHISILLSHQTFSDLEKVSPEFAKGIWDNTRNKVVLFQNDFEICDRIAKGLGTKKGIELTVRRSTDGFLNQTSMLEASSKEVDSYRCHPNRIKSLAVGQAYLAQDADFVGVNLRQVPELPLVEKPAPRVPTVEGLGLHDLYVANGVPVAPPSAGASTGGQ